MARNRVEWTDDMRRMLAEISGSFADGGCSYEAAKFLNRLVDRRNSGSPISDTDQVLLEMLHRERTASKPAQSN